MLERAANRAQSLGAPSEALRLMEAALALGPEPESAARLHRAACAAANDAARPARGIEHGTAAVALYEGLGAVSEAGLAAAETARCYRASGDMQPAIELLASHGPASSMRPGPIPRRSCGSAGSCPPPTRIAGSSMRPARTWIGSSRWPSARETWASWPTRSTAWRGSTPAGGGPTGYVLLQAAADVRRRRLGPGGCPEHS